MRFSKVTKMIIYDHFADKVVIKAMAGQWGSNFKGPENYVRQVGLLP